MTNRELKSLIKNAYEVEPSKGKSKFLKQYQKRELHLFDLVKQQLVSVVGVSNILTGLTILFSFWQILMQADQGNVYEFIRISCIMPLVGMATLTGFGRSERFNMDELELSTRFSLRTVVLARLIVIGVIDMIVIAGVLLLSGRLMNIEVMQSFIIITIPYLISTWGCLFITRKLHSNKEIAVCIGYLAMVCSLFAITTEQTPWAFLFLGTASSYIFLITLCVLLGIEINKLVKGENTRWNFC